MISLLGRGGMGEVWRARDLTLRRDVALKVVSGHAAPDGESLARFEREAQLLASLNHPHIASIYGVERSSAGVALILELVEGPTLGDLIARGPVAVSEAIRIARQVAAAVEAAHDRGIIHRDLKPGNVKLTADGQVKVLDFGLARMGDTSPACIDVSAAVTNPVLATASGVILGTPAYMSPEQAKGQRLDRRCDNWAFGCILYELLTGRRAFAGDSVAEVMTSVLSRDADLTALPPETPPSVAALVRRCFERNPAERLRDIGEARVVLERPNAWVTAVTPSAGAGTRRVPVRVALGGLAVGALLGVAAALVWTRTPEPPPREVMQFTLPLAPAAHLASATPFKRPRETAIAISRDGRVVIFAGETGTGAATEWALYRREIGQPLATQVAGTGGAMAGYLSPDGEWVAFAGPRGMLRKVALAGGNPIDLGALDLAALGGGMAGGSWGEDGSIILGAKSGPLRRVPASGGPAVAMTTLAPRERDYAHRHPHHLPNGGGVLYTAVADPLGAGGRVFVLPPAGGEPRLVLENAADARYVRGGHLAFVRDGTLMVAPFDPDRLAVTGAPAPAVQEVMQALGSDDPELNSGAAQYAVSETGTLVYASGGVFPTMTNRLLWLHRDGTTQPIGEPGRSLLGPRIAPDGGAIAVAQVADPKQPLLTYDIRRQLWTPFVGLTGNSIAFPVWTPDGREVVFVWNGAIHIMRADGSAPPRQVTDGSPSRVPGDVSPNGLLAFVEMNHSTKADIWVMPLDGSVKPRPAVETPGADVQPVFGPDGHWLAYASDAAGGMEVFLQAFPGPGPRLQVSSGGGVAPMWAHDGRTLFYVRPSPEAMLMEVPTQLAPELRAGAPRAITRFPYILSGPARSVDVVADGQRFVVTTYEPMVPAPVTELHVIVNWLAK